MLSMPLLASLVLLILTILMPSFFSAPKMTWPLACAWPITSAAVLYGLHLLSIGDAWSMIRIEGVPRFDLLWGDWLPLGVSAIAQFVILLFLPAENSEEEDA